MTATVMRAQTWARVHWQAPGLAPARYESCDHGVPDVEAIGDASEEADDAVGEQAVDPDATLEHTEHEYRPAGSDDGVVYADEPQPGQYVRPAAMNAPNMSASMRVSVSE